MVSRFEPVLSENHYRVSVKVVIMVKVILVIFVSGMCFQCHYINIIKLYFIVSRKESVKSFLTLMTHDLNDQLRTMTITMTAIRIEAINLHKVWSFGHWSLWSFSFSISLPTINHKLYTINLHHKCRETDDGPSGKVLQHQAKCHTFAADLSDTSFQSSLITEGGLNL